MGRGGGGHSGKQVPHVEEFAQKVKVVRPGVEELSQAASLTPRVGPAGPVNVARTVTSCPLLGGVA